MQFAPTSGFWWGFYGFYRPLVLKTLHVNDKKNGQNSIFGSFTPKIVSGLAGFYFY